ncbi:MAG: DUF2993 domain-containing protein [Synechococcales bacterium]|nr:DUF2993 domain-containing protein [Synechococcales bacterium]
MSDAPNLPQKGLISKILAPAIRFWLKSQVEQIEQLQLDIEAGDRQFLSGRIPKVTLAAQGALYQGIHLSQAQLVGENIHVNLGQVLRGKPLQLLEPFPIALNLFLTEADLNLSLQAPLLATALKGFLLNLLQSSGDLMPTHASVASSAQSERSAQPDISPSPASPPVDLNLQNLKLTLEESRLCLSAQLISHSGTVTPIALRTGLQLHQTNQLILHQPQWLPHPTAKRGLPLDDLEGYPIFLGETTQLDYLTLQAGSLECQGQLQVNP